MFLRLVRILCLTCVVHNATAEDTVSIWLRHMGCEELLASYLEEQLDHVDNKVRLNAAMELADLYALLLSRADEGSDQVTLQRANALLDRIPQADTIDLRLQLLRATYLASEQMLERYRLRSTSKEQADAAVEQLRVIVDDFETIRKNLLVSSRSPSDRKRQRIGISTSLLAWSHYYSAWYKRDIQEAKISANLFASILLGETASLSKLSLDLKSTEYGSRALLGIALCKDISNDPEGTAPWFDELNDPATWRSVQLQIPMWQYFLDIDHQRWSDVIVGMRKVQGVDRSLLLRLAAVHSLEHYGNETAQAVAQHALSDLIELGQLSMVSVIVEKYGFSALRAHGFIVSYIQGDLEYRTAKEEMFTDEPSDEPDVIRQFRSAANKFRRALNADDVDKFGNLQDECHYMLGLASFYASEFIEAVDAFQIAAVGDKPEHAIWMAIVCLDHIDNLTLAQYALKDQLVEQYISSWPKSHRATQLLLLASGDEPVDRNHIVELLAVPRSDPRFEEVQRKVARLLYKAWQMTDPLDRTDTGNRYISIAIPIMIADHDLKDDGRAAIRASVRAYRVLEVSLHSEISRLIAADQAFAVLRELKQAGKFDMSEQASELKYRKVVASLLAHDEDTSISIASSMIQHLPDDEWTTLAARVIWQSWEDDQEIKDNIRYQIGMQLLRHLSDAQLARLQVIDISIATANAAFDLYIAKGIEEVGHDSLRIARALIKAYPKSKLFLRMNAVIEMELGNLQFAIDHWRTIASGTQRGGGEWLEARFHIIAHISINNPHEALAILDQHCAMYPSYGVNPFGEKLRELHLTLKRLPDGS